MTIKINWFSLAEEIEKCETNFLPLDDIVWLRKALRFCIFPGISQKCRRDQSEAAHMTISKANTLRGDKRSRLLNMRHF